MALSSQDRLDINDLINLHGHVQEERGGVAPAPPA